MRFNIGLCGDGQLDPRMRSSASQELIRRLCEVPVPIEDIEPELLDVFRKMRAVQPLLRQKRLARLLAGCLGAELQPMVNRRKEVHQWSAETEGFSLFQTHWCSR